MLKAVDVEWCGREWEGTYGDLKVHHLLDPGAHLVVEAEAVLARLFCREDGVELPLFTVLHYDLVVGAYDAVVDVEGAARLDLYKSTGHY